MKSYLKIVGVFWLFGSLATSKGYCDGNVAGGSTNDVEARPMASPTPQDTTTNIAVQTPVGLLNQTPSTAIGNQPLNQAGIYPQGGALLVDRAVVLPNTLSVSSVTVSSMNVTGALQVPNGVNAGDAAAFGQLPTFKLVCSSTTDESRSTTGSAFIASPLGCSGTLSSASHHALVFANPEIRNSTAGNITEGAMFVDGVNQDDSSQGQCHVFAATGISDNRVSCNILLYYAPGNTTSHTYQFYFGNSGGTQQFYPSTARMLVFEVP